MQLLIKCTVLSVSMLTIVLPQRLAVACGVNINPGEYRFWLLQPDLTNEADLTPFFFSSNYLYNNDMYAAKEKWPELNIMEWKQQLNAKVEKKDIDGLLNATMPQEYFENPEQIADTNSFMRELLQPSNSELCRYMTLSKQVEQVAANPDPWEEEIYPDEHVQTVIRNGRELYHSSRSPFVKFRTAFQLMRLLDKKQSDSVYYTVIAPSKIKSWINSAALYRVALYSSGHQRDYLLSKVFDRGDYNRTACLVNFNSQHLDSILPFAKNTHERNVLLAMKVFNYKGRSLQWLKAINQSEPELKELPFLILREINKVEDWLMTENLSYSVVPASYNFSDPRNDYYDGAATNNYNNDKAYANSLYAFINAIIMHKKSCQVSLLNVYAAHLSLILGNYQLSAQHLDQAAKGKKLSNTAKTQLQIEHYLLQLEKGFDQNTENALMKILNTSNEQLGIYNPDIMKNQLILYTGQKLVRQGNKAKGLMLLSRTSRTMIGGLYGSKNLYEEISDVAEPTDYDEILNTLDKKDKTPFEQFISTRIFNWPQNWYADTTEQEFFYLAHWNKDLLLDLKSSWFIRNYQLPEALVVLKQIPSSYWNAYPQSSFNRGDPFYVNINRPHRMTRQDSSRNLDKVQIIEEMVRLQALAESNPSIAAKCYYQLANAFYNMSWYGKNWLMVRLWWSTDEVRWRSENKENNDRFNRNYYGCEQAGKFYQKAIDHTDEKQLAALCFFMKEECKNNMEEFRFYSNRPLQISRVYKRKNILNTRLAKQQNIDLEYYTSLVEECELYQSFTSKYASPVSNYAF